MNNSRVFTSTSTSTFPYHPPIPLTPPVFLPFSRPPFRLLYLPTMNLHTFHPLTIHLNRINLFCIVNPLVLYTSTYTSVSTASLPPSTHPTRLRSTHHIRHTNSLFRHLHLHLTLILPLVVHLLQHNRHNQPNPAPTAMLLLEGTLFKILV